MQIYGNIGFKIILLAALLVVGVLQYSLLPLTLPKKIILKPIDGLTPDRTIFQALGAMNAGRLILGLTISINSVYGAETKSTRILRRHP